MFTYFKINMRTHTGENPFKFQVYLKYFNRNSNLFYDIYIRTHTREKPFERQVCLNYYFNEVFKRHTCKFTWKKNHLNVMSVISLI